MSDELHPEELLARAAARALGPDEAADLRAHLERCPACALQVDLRATLDRALAPTDADYELGARAVERLLASDEPALRPVATLRRSRGGARTAARAALVALMLVGTGVGAAALVHRARTGHFWGEKTDAASPGALAVSRKRAREARVVIAEPAAAPPPVAEPPAAVVEVPSPAPAPAIVAPRLPALRAVASPRSQPSAEAPPPADPPPVESPPVVETPANGAALLFQAAERTRRAGDAAGAERLYARLAAEFPGSREEVAGRALRGQLLVDQLGRPVEALAAFESYLRAQPQGVLGEETRAARAETLGRLGRRREEGAAWRELLASYPRSIYAARARERLAALAQARD